ncbi:extensin-like [Penaeus chinensis]|uniref:extensin-like n=1 Tax=Penaeus chinensis TaxID=139456 RepID=UPI001FB71940|nr:extensin-like [Penaeus chinensis]
MAAERSRVHSRDPCQTYDPTAQPPHIDPLTSASSRASSSPGRRRVRCQRTPVSLAPPRHTTTTRPAPPPRHRHHPARSTTPPRHHPARSTRPAPPRYIATTRPAPPRYHATMPPPAARSTSQSPPPARSTGPSPPLPFAPVATTSSPPRPPTLFGPVRLITITDLSPPPPSLTLSCIITIIGVHLVTASTLLTTPLTPHHCIITIITNTSPLHPHSRLVTVKTFPSTSSPPLASFHNNSGRRRSTSAPPPPPPLRPITITWPFLTITNPSRPLALRKPNAGAAGKSPPWLRWCRGAAVE